MNEEPAKDFQLILAELEKYAAAWEQKAKDHEVNVREFRSCFAKYGGKRGWRERFEKIEIAITSNETAAAEYRELAERARRDAEEVKLILDRDKSQEAIMQIIKDSALSVSQKKQFADFVEQGELEEALCYAIGYIQSMERTVDKVVALAETAKKLRQSMATTSDTRH